MDPGHQLDALGLCRRLERRRELDRLGQAASGQRFSERDVEAGPERWPGPGSERPRCGRAPPLALRASPGHPRTTTSPNARDDGYGPTHRRRWVKSPPRPAYADDAQAGIPGAEQALAAERPVLAILERDDGHLVARRCAGPPVVRRLLRRIIGRRGRVERGVERGVAPAADVVGAARLEQQSQEVLGMREVRGPAELPHRRRILVEALGVAPAKDMTSRPADAQLAPELRGDRRVVQRAGGDEGHVREACAAGISRCRKRGPRGIRVVSGREVALAAQLRCPPARWTWPGSSRRRTSSTSRRQSTAHANAWRTRSSSNGGRVVSKPRYWTSRPCVRRSCGPRARSYATHRASSALMGTRSTEPAWNESTGPSSEPVRCRMRCDGRSTSPVTVVGLEGRMPSPSWPPARSHRTPRGHPAGSGPVARSPRSAGTIGEGRRRGGRWEPGRGTNEVHGHDIVALGAEAHGDSHRPRPPGTPRHLRCR